MTHTPPPAGRDYQLAAVTAVRAAFARLLFAVLCVLPTGAGKTTVLALIAQAVVGKGKRVWSLVHRGELRDQIRERQELYGINVGCISPGYADTTATRLSQSCMVQTLANRLAGIPDELLPDVVFIDEAHRAISPTCVKVIAELKRRKPSVLLIGLTATPWRLDKKGMCEQFDEIVAPISISEMIARGFLLQPRYYATEADLEGLETKGQDYDADDLFKRFNKRELYAGTVRNYLNFGQELPAVCYCINVEHSQKTAEAFNADGIRACHIDGTTPSGLRKQMLADFRAGRYQVMCNADLFTEGLDVPEIGCVMLNRATQSLALFIQMVGRGARPIAGQTATDDAQRVAAVAGSSKPRFVVIDQGSNLKTHGFWEDERAYSLDPPEKKKKGKKQALDVAPVKTCPSCCQLVRAQLAECDVCGYQWPKSYEKAKEAELVEIRRDEVRIGGLVVSQHRPKAARMPEHLEGRGMWTLSEQEWREVAHFRGHHPGWIKYQPAYAACLARNGEAAEGYQTPQVA